MSDDEYQPAVPSEQIEEMSADENTLERKTKGRRERTDKQKQAFEKARLKRLDNIRRNKEKKDKPVEVQKPDKKRQTKKVRQKIIMISESDSSESEDIEERIVYKKKSKKVKDPTKKKKREIVYHSDSSDSQEDTTSEDELPREKPKRRRERRPTFYEPEDFGIDFV